MKCLHCSIENPDGSEWCKNCGDILQTDSEGLLLKRAEYFSKYGVVFPTKKFPGLAVFPYPCRSIYAELAMTPERALERVEEGYKVILVMQSDTIAYTPNSKEAIEKAEAVISIEGGQYGYVANYTRITGKPCITQCKVRGKDGEWAEIDFKNSCVYL